MADLDPYRVVMDAAYADHPLVVEARLLEPVPPVIGHKVLSARVDLEPRHFHVADLVGDAFYRDGVRMKNAVCRTCGETMEARRA